MYHLLLNQEVKTVLLEGVKAFVTSVCGELGRVMVQKTVAAFEPPPRAEEKKEVTP